MDAKDRITRLLSLFDHRTKLTDSCNRRILDVIRSNVVVAIEELVALEESAITWDAVELIDNQALAIQFTIEYDPTSSMSPFLTLMNVNAPNEPSVLIQRTVMFCVPLETINLSIDDIKKWLMEAASKTFTSDQGIDRVVPTQPTARPVEQSQSFDPSLLTSEQIAQMLYFQQLTKSIKQ